MYLDKIHIVDMLYMSVDILRYDRTSTFGFRVSHKSQPLIVSRKELCRVLCYVMYICSYVRTLAELCEDVAS